MIDVFHIGWQVKPTIQALTTTRIGGFSRGVYAGLNLGDHVRDDINAVAANRKALADQLNLVSQPKWLNQTHGIRIVAADNLAAKADADGSYTTKTDCVCAVLTADCLPVFLADQNGQAVGVFHAGWRGLAGGILSNAITKMLQYSDKLIAAIGPAISQSSFEVGGEVKDVFLANNAKAEPFFAKSNNHGHYYADLYGLAKLQLIESGVESVWLPDSVCTYKDPERFYSYRRDGQTGRMASLIWISQ